MARSPSMSADYKIATGPFHFCLDKAAVLNDFTRSAFVLDRTASIWRKEAYSCCLFCFCFSRPPRPNRVYHRPLQTKKPLKQLRKPSKTTSYIANEAKIGNKSEFDYSLYRWVVSTRSIVLPTSALRNVNVVTRKLDLDQTSAAYTHTERNKCDKKRGSDPLVIIN